MKFLLPLIILTAAVSAAPFDARFVRRNAGNTAWGNIDLADPGADQYLKWDNTANTFVWDSPAGAGTVTNVTWTGGIVSIATPASTPAFTIAGTSGGIPYFNSGTTWATSAALASNALVIGGGAGVAPASTITGTGVVTALGVNVGSAGAFVTFNGAGGTPSSLVGTNITGTAAGLTAGNVTTNANLTGHVTSVGNAAVLGSFTLAQLSTAVSDANVARTDAGQVFTGIQDFTSPSIQTSITTPSGTFSLLNTTATTVNAFGTATTLNIGAGAATVLNFGGAAGAAELRFLEPSGSGTNYTGWKAAPQVASHTYTWPNVAPNAGEVLGDSNADNILEWLAPAGGGDVTAAANFGTDERIIVSDGTGKGVKSTPVTLDSAGAMSGITNLVVDGPALLQGPITFGINGVQTGSTLFKGLTSGTVTIGVADVAGTWAGKWPLNDGDPGEVLSTDGSGQMDWIPSTGSPAGANTNIQYNNSGSFGAEAAFTYNAGTNTLVADNIIASGTTTAGTVNVGGTTSTNVFRILDNVNQSHGLSFVVASDLTADRILTLTTGDAARALTIFGDTTIPVFGQQVTFAGPTAARTYTLTDANSTIYSTGGTDVALADGGTGASLADPNADRLMFWDDSAGATAYLTLGTNLSITGTTIDAAGGGSGGTAGAPLFVQTASAAAVTSGAETTVLAAGAGSLTIPAAWFTAAGNVMDVRFSGKYSTGLTPGTLQLKLKLGATVVAQTIAFTPIVSVTDGIYSGFIRLVARTVGASGTIFVADGLFTTGSTITPGEVIFSNPTLGTAVTVDTTATQVVDLTATWGTAATNSITGYTFEMVGPGSAVSSVFGMTGAVANLSGDVATAGSSVTTIQANSVALTTDTTGNYAAGDAEAGAALTGDSATSFFSAGTLETARLNASLQTGQIAFYVGNGTDVITTGYKGGVRINYGGTITGVEITSEDASTTSGSVVVDVWKDTYANFPPTNADSITAADKPTVTTATKSQDTDVSTWTTTFAAGDRLAFEVESVTSFTKILVVLTTTKN